MKLSKKKKMTSTYGPNLPLDLDEYGLMAGITALIGAPAGSLIGWGVGALMSFGTDAQQAAENIFNGQIIGAAIPLAVAGLIIGLPAAKTFAEKVRSKHNQKEM